MPLSLPVVVRLVEVPDSSAGERQRSREGPAPVNLGGLVDARWEAFANWLAMDESMRKRLNLPLNQTEYALANKMSDRQLRRWKTDPVFKALVDKKLGISAPPTPSATVGARSVEAAPLPSDEEPEQSTPEDEYLAIKSALVKGALTGDPKYLDLYFKTYGKEFVAEEAAARTSDLAGLDLADLILEAAASLDRDRLAAYLVDQGYEVRPPEGATNGAE